MYYAELIDPNTGKKLTARSTETKSRDEALLRVADWLKNGLPGQKTIEAAVGIETVIKYLRRLDIDSDDALMSGRKKRTGIYLRMLKPPAKPVRLEKAMPCKER
jgi:hypothetical protein